MKHHVMLVTGGTRCGKSFFAETQATLLGRGIVYVATAEAKDSEMKKRIRDHQKRRSGSWQTVEEPIEIVKVLQDYERKADCLLVDCITLWISNLLLLGGQHTVERGVEELMQQIPKLDAHLIMVGNEVGWGIVPQNPLAREFRDLIGWTHQQIGAIATDVVLMVAGIPMVVKGRGHADGSKYTRPSVP